MVDLDSDRVPRVPPYSGTASASPIHFAYVAFTHSGSPSQMILLCIGFLSNLPGHPHAVLQPHIKWFGLLPVRSPLLRESLLMSVPVLLRWFTSHSIAPVPYIFRHSGNGIATIGLLHSEIRGLTVICTSPRLIAAYHVLLRLSAPRHPP